MAKICVCCGRACVQLSEDGLCFSCFRRCSPVPLQVPIVASLEEIEGVAG
jgi:hypothetical protein